MNKIIKKGIIIAIVLMVITIITIGTIITNAASSTPSASDNITLNFGNLGKSYTRTAREWRENYLEPTIIEANEGGDWYIIWAVNDPVRKNNTYYTTVGYRIHTKPASGSANTINYGGSAGKSKLVNNFKNYGVESKMGKVITVWESDANFDSIREQELDDGENYFFRLIKLTKENRAALNYTSGPLYFSGILCNYQNGSLMSTETSPGVSVNKFKTYVDWSRWGMHNVVTDSTTTRKGLELKYDKTSPNYGVINNLNQLKTDAPYIYVVNNHYDRLINTDKVIENRNVTVEIYINGALSTERTMTKTNVLKGSAVKVFDNKELIKLTVGSYENTVVSPIKEYYEFDHATLNEQPYDAINTETVKSMGEEDMLFRLYYTGDGKKDLNDVTVYTVVYKENGYYAASGYRDTNNHLRNSQTIEGLEPNTEQKISVTESLTKDTTYYEFARATTYINGNIDSNSERIVFNPIYTYNVGDEAEITEVVLEYVEAEPTGEEEEKEYTDESLSAFSFGHILSDSDKNNGGKEYNVLNGIPSSEYVYSYAEANGYLYKIKGNCVTGTKPYEVVYYSIETDELTGIQTLSTTKGYADNNYSFYTIEEYEVLGLDEMYITNPILEGGQNIFEIDDISVELMGNTGKTYTSSEERYNDYVTRTGLSKETEKFMINSMINMINYNNNAIAKQAEEEGKTVNYTTYSIDDFEFTDSIFYVNKNDIFTGDVLTADEANKLAKAHIEMSLIENSDYIKVSSSDGIKNIKPESNFALLSYDISNYIGTEAQKDAYKNGESLTWYEKIFKWLVEKIQEALDWIKTQWDKLIAWILGESTGGEVTYEDVIKEYNDAVSSYNSLPRDVFRVGRNQLGQQIPATYHNGEYKTTQSGVTYRLAASNANLISAEVKNTPQQMNGLTILLDNSYHLAKNSLLSGGVYLAEKVNNVFVHTPVYINAVFNGAGDTQYNGNSLFEDDKVNIVEVGKKYTINLETTGMHRDILGYGNRDYSLYTKSDSIYMRFPYDIYATIGGVRKLCKANEWYQIGNVSNIEIEIPDWAETPPEETRHYDGVVYYDIRVSAINDDLTANPDELGWENANKDSDNSYRKVYDNMPKDYRAHYSIPVYAVGKVYDFRVNFTIDSQYLLSYTSGKLKDGATGQLPVNANDKYKEDGLSIQNLPIGKSGTNPSNLTYTKAPKLGNKFKFNLKTLGWKTNKIQIEPIFYFIPKDNTKAPYQVDVYYQDKNTGKYTKLEDNENYTLSTTLPNATTQVPNSTQKVTEPGPDSTRVNATNRVKDAYSKGYIHQFMPTYLNRITSSKTDYIGDLGMIQLDEKERIRLPESNELKEMASNSIWYGEYKLPSTSRFVREGYSFEEENILTKVKNGDGYILVCFKITGIYNQGNNDYIYLSYQKENGSGTTQWYKEGYTNSNIPLVNGQTYNLPGSSTEHVGVFLYEAFENNGEDVVNPH